MEDLSATIHPKSDQLNSDDLIAGPMTITVRKVTASASSEDQPVSIFFEGDNNKPYKPSKGMRRVLVAAWSKDGSTYVGKSMTLFREPTVKFGGLEVGGIQISHLSHITKPMTLALTATRGSRKPFTVRPLVIEVQTANEEILDAARDAARQGKDAFSEHWKSITKPERAIVNTIIAECKKLTEEAEADADVDNLPDDYDAGNITDDPFEGEK